MMSKISEAAGLSRIYTNHSLRSTGITILDQANVEGRHIIGHTGHASVNSLSSYLGQVSNKKKEDMSRHIGNRVDKKPNPETPAKNDKFQSPASTVDLSPLLTVSQELALLNEGEPFDIIDLPDQDGFNKNEPKLPRAASTHVSTSQVLQNTINLPFQTSGNMAPGLQPVIQNCQVTINYNIMQN